MTWRSTGLPVQIITKEKIIYPTPQLVNYLKIHRTSSALNRICKAKHMQPNKNERTLLADMNDESNMYRLKEISHYNLKFWKESQKTKINARHNLKTISILKSTTLLLLLLWLFDDEEPHQGRPIWTNSWGVNHGYMAPSTKIVYLVILGWLLMGINPKMSKFTTQTKPPPIRLRPDEFKETALLATCSNSSISYWVQ